MSKGAGPSKKPKTFHTEWEQDFFPTMSFSKCVCLICQSSIAIPKKGNVERHFRAVHKIYDTFLRKSELSKRKLKELKSQLSGQQSFFSQRNQSVSQSASRSAAVDVQTMQAWSPPPLHPFQ